MTEIPNLVSFDSADQASRKMGGGRNIKQRGVSKKQFIPTNTLIIWNRGNVPTFVNSEWKEVIDFRHLPPIGRSRYWIIAEVPEEIVKNITKGCLHLYKSSFIVYNNTIWKAKSYLIETVYEATEDVNKAVQGSF